MIGKYSDEMTFDYIMNRMLESVPDTVDKREGSIIYDALSPAAAELAKAYMELDVVMDETFVDTASLQYLMLRCKERGVTIQGETAAVIQGVFTPTDIEMSERRRYGKADEYRVGLHCAPYGAHQQGTDRHRPRTEPR